MQQLATLRRETHAALCLACGKCSTMCPLAPSGWFSAARMVAIRDSGRDLAGQAPALDACLTCGACEQRCPEGVHFVDFVRGVRTIAAPASRHACPHGEMLQSAARLAAGPRTPTRDLSWIDGDLAVAEEGEVGLFVGCLPFFDLLFHDELALETVDIARAAIRLLNGLGIEPVVLAEERCCGHDLLWNGERETFQELAAANAAAFAAHGVKHLLTTCAECCSTWRRDVAAAAPDYRPRVEHFAEFLARQIADGALAADGHAPRVTFQDPCRLGRHLGVTEAPRTVLTAIADGASALVEMKGSGRDAVCCGTAGFMHCDANSRRLQSARLASAAATGAETLVTACPKCLIHFRCAQHEDHRRRRSTAAIEVEDLTLLAARTLRPTRSSAAGADPKQQSTGDAT